MRIIETRELTGQSGKCYPANVYPADMRFNDFIPGVLVFFDADKTLFVEHSDNVDAYLQKNQVAARLQGAGLTQIALIKNASREVREATVTDLQASLSPSITSLPDAN